MHYTERRGMTTSKLKKNASDRSAISQDLKEESLCGTGIYAVLETGGEGTFFCRL
jgi:hypothetical protein